MDTAKLVISWGVVIGAGAGFWFVANQRKQKNRRTTAPKSTGKVTEPRKEPKAKKARKDVPSDQDTKQGQKKNVQQKPTHSATEEKAYTSAIDDKIDDEVDNHEFARQLSNAKSGTIIAGKAQASSGRPKSVKQTRAQEKPAVDNSSDNATAPSSTAGADADDDESPIHSPELKATPMNGGVSDMLEAPAAGPSVLRITSPTNAIPAQKAKAPKPAEVKETKKQRQNRQKAETQKLAREAEEKQRKVLEEKQRRTAREAEGRAAKDGSAFMASKAPSSSAWTAPVTNGTKASSTSDFELLDTEELIKTNGNGEKSTEVPSEAPSSQLANGYSGLSEEEQIRIIQEESADWKTVSKEKRKKKNPVKETAEETQTSTSSAQDFGPPPVIAPTGPGQVWSVKTVHVEPETRKIVEREVEVQDSEWEVA